MGRRVHALGQKSLELGLICGLRRNLIPSSLTFHAGSVVLCPQRVEPALGRAQRTRYGGFNVAATSLEKRFLAHPKSRLAVTTPALAGLAFGHFAASEQILARVGRARPPRTLAPNLGSWRLLR